MSELEELQKEVHQIKHVAGVVFWSIFWVAFAIFVLWLMFINSQSKDPGASEGTCQSVQTCQCYTSTMVIAVDFDGTIHDPNNKNSGYRMGVPIPGAILSMQRLANSGHTLIIFTARGVQHPNQKKAVADWLDYFKIPFSGITNIKSPAFDLIIDNRAMHFDSWPQVMARLTKSEQPSITQFIAFTNRNARNQEK